MGKLTAQQETELIRKKLKHRSTEEDRVKFYMDTGEPLLHLALGSEAKGIPYGKIYEISGNESQGKTALVLDLAAQAQYDGAAVGWGDIEMGSFDPEWAKIRGLEPDKVRLFEPYIGLFGKETAERLINAEEMCEEMETWMGWVHQQNPEQKIFLGIDSVAALETEVEADAGVTNQNMKTNMGLPAFLSKLLRRWVARAAIYNAMIVFTNQLRTKPMAFGNPEYTPGGKAMKFYASSRAVMRRVKGGKLTKGPKIIGIKGTITNTKNKCGGGSVEGAKIGFKLYFNGAAKFMKVEDLE